MRHIVGNLKGVNMKLSVEVSDKLRRRIKKQTDLSKRPALHEAAKLLEEALDAREGKGTK